MNTVLIAKQDPERLHAKAQLLICHGYTVHQAGSGREALALAGAHKPDLVLLDAELTDIHAVDLCRQLKGEPSTHRSFVVLLSSFAGPAESVDIGASDGYLVKPVNDQAFLAGVDGFLRHKATLDQLQASQDERRQRQADILAALGGLDPLRATRRAFGIPPLSESHGEVFAELCEEYNQVLELALQRQIFRGENRASIVLRDLALKLHRLHAGARDVTEMHSATLKRRTRTEDPARAQGYLDAGRMALVELMGLLLNLYRHHDGGPLVPQSSPSLRRDQP